MNRSPSVDRLEPRTLLHTMVIVSPGDLAVIDLSLRPVVITGTKGDDVIELSAAAAAATRS